MRAFALIASIAAAGFFALQAGGGDVRGTDPAGDVKVPGLTAAERAAIDIRSVRVLGAEGLGVMVDVKFGGSVETLLGHGHLANAAVGIVLRPKAGAGAPAGLLTMGAEFATRTVRLSATKRGTYLVPQEKDLRRTHSADVQILRSGRDVYFWIWGPGLSNVATVDARSFASLRPRSGFLLQKPVGDDIWDPFSQNKPSDDDEEAPDAQELTPAQLQLMKAVEQNRANVLEKRAGEVAAARNHINDVLLPQIRKGNPAAAGALETAIGALDALLHEYDEAISATHAKINLIDELLQESQQPPPPPETKMLTGGCTFFDPMEVTCTASFTGGSQRFSTAAAAIDSIKVVLPPSGSTTRTITNQLCPSQLPAASVPASDTLVCSGGTLATGATFSFDIRMSPAPTAGMGLQVYAGTNGSYQGPFALSGP